MSCPCRCHLGGVFPSCDTGTVQPGGQLYCGPCDGGADEIPLEERCVLAHDEPAKRYLGLLCGRHYHRILNRLREIEELFALKDEAMLPGPGGDGRHATRFGSPAPGRIELMEITDQRMTIADDVPDLPGVLAQWVRMVCEERDLDDQLTGDVTQSVRILRREHKWIAAQPWVDDYDGELHDLHRAIARGIGASMWPESIGLCPNCGAKLYPTLGVDAVTCRRCTAQWTGVDLARLRLIHEQEAK